MVMLLNYRLLITCNDIFDESLLRSLRYVNVRHFERNFCYYFEMALNEMYALCTYKLHIFKEESQCSDICKLKNFSRIMLRLIFIYIYFFANNNNCIFSPTKPLKITRLQKNSKKKSGNVSKNKM